MIYTGITVTLEEGMVLRLELYGAAATITKTKQFWMP